MVLRAKDGAQTRNMLPEKELHLTFSSLGRWQMGEYSKPFGNVGERACACRGARIPEEGAQRPTSLDWVLGAGIFMASHYIALAMDGEGNYTNSSNMLLIEN